MQNELLLRIVLMFASAYNEAGYNSLTNPEDLTS
jgi:hypothetical protein